jgi:hypothetical protein
MSAFPAPEFRHGSCPNPNRLAPGRGPARRWWRRDTEDNTMKRLLLAMSAGLAATLTAGGCATTMSISSHVDRTISFAQYRTFDWGPADALPTGDPRLDRDPFFKDHVQGAVERELAGRGLELSPSGTPDILIHYHANITKRIDVNQADRAYGYCGATDCPPESVEYEAGTLVLDFMDAHTNKLIWRGWAQNSVEDMLRNRDKMASTIDQAVAGMLRQLPRAR